MIGFLVVQLYVKLVAEVEGKLQGSCELRAVSYEQKVKAYN